MIPYEQSLQALNIDEQEWSLWSVGKQEQWKKACDALKTHSPQELMKKALKGGWPWSGMMHWLSYHERSQLERYIQHMSERENERVRAQEQNGMLKSSMPMEFEHTKDVDQELIETQRLEFWQAFWCQWQWNQWSQWTMASYRWLNDPGLAFVREEVQYWVNEKQPQIEHKLMEHKDYWEEVSRMLAHQNDDLKMQAREQQKKQWINEEKEILEKKEELLDGHVGDLKLTGKKEKWRPPVVKVPQYGKEPVRTPEQSVARALDVFAQVILSCASHDPSMRLDCEKTIQKRNPAAALTAKAMMEHFSHHVGIIQSCRSQLNVNGVQVHPIMTASMKGPNVSPWDSKFKSEKLTPPEPKEVKEQLDLFKASDKASDQSILSENVKREMNASDTFSKDTVLEKIKERKVQSQASPSQNVLTDRLDKKMKSSGF